MTVFALCRMSRCAGALLSIVAASAAVATAEPAAPIRLHPDNPHLFLWRGKPTVLATAGEHYGAVMNLDFDYKPYLEVLGQAGMNLTRVFSGAYLERTEDINWMGTENTLAPGPGRVLAPWARSRVAGYAGGGNKLDLDRWDPTYFHRLKDFVAEAGRRGIVVEYVFFSQMYGESQWSVSPLRHTNNVQGVGKGAPAAFNTLTEAALTERQTALVKKAIGELVAFDNVYFEICNEPDASNPEVVKWHDRMIAAAVEAGAGRDGRHMIAVNYDHPRALAHLHAAVSVLNAHYPYGRGWLGAMPLLEGYSDLDRALSFDETIGLPHHASAERGRLEAWAFLLGGGTVYDHLSWEHTVSAERGALPDGKKMRTYIRNARAFLESFDLVRMKRDTSVLRAAVPSVALFSSAISQPGRQYALYFHHSNLAENQLKVARGPFEYDVSFKLPTGSYRVEWVSPATLAVLRADDITTDGGAVVLTTPRYETDVAVRIQAVK